jgi:hypothetical protein
MTLLSLLAQVVPPSIPTVPVLPQPGDAGTGDWIRLLTGVGTPGVAAVVLYYVINMVRDLVKESREATEALIKMVMEGQAAAAKDLKEAMVTAQATAQTNLSVMLQARELITALKSKPGG